MTTRKLLFASVGTILAAFALYSAYAYQFKHFYEFLVVGLFLILYGVVDGLISTAEYKDLALKFVKAGLVGDLLIGVTLTGLWRYNFSGLADYFPVYLIVYPFAGLVMVQSYVLVKHRLMPDAKAALRSKRVYSRLTLFLVASTLAVATLLIFLPNSRRLLWPFLFLSLGLYVLAAFSLRIRLIKVAGLFDFIWARPFKMLAVILIVSYFNAFLHELPNTVAQEWTYTNWPLQHLQILDIPVLVLVGWPFLTLYPAAVYYYVRAKHRDSKIDRESRLVKFSPIVLPPKIN